MDEILIAPVQGSVIIPYATAKHRREAQRRATQISDQILRLGYEPHLSIYYDLAGEDSGWQLALARVSAGDSRTIAVADTDGIPGGLTVQQQVLSELGARVMLVELAPPPRRRIWLPFSRR